MFATLNSILRGFAVENSHVIKPAVVPTAFTTGFRYSRLYVPVLSSVDDISLISSGSFSRSIITSPESPLPEKSAFESDV
jgi:hypothetical protein